MRIIVVSNRLHLTASVQGEELIFHASSGGLATGIKTCLRGVDTPTVWVGWPGTFIPPEFEDSCRSALKDENAVPVFLSQKNVDQHYFGFCNKTLWPLFHSFVWLTQYDSEEFEAFREVNLLFAQTLRDILLPDDIVWIHDFHLCLLPAILRLEFPNIAIGFFLHIPFPSLEIVQTLPKLWRDSILDGLLGSNVVGFHTNDYAQNFLRCSLRMFGIDHKFGTLTFKGHIVKVGSFPMGIDYDLFNRHSPKSYAEMNPAIRYVLSIDRLDYTKGIPQRLEAYEKFLDSFPCWHQKVTLVIIIVPSREAVEQYKLMRQQIEEMIGRISGKYATLSWSPILYQYRCLSFDELTFYYRMCDVALVTPLRDGMNLIAKEYIASRKTGSGVLILSEMAGAAAEMSECIIINPYDIHGTSRAINEALLVPLEDQRQRNFIIRRRLERYNILRWWNDFYSSLQSSIAENAKIYSRLLHPSELVAAWRSTPKRLLLLDYDGTLVPFNTNPKLCAPPSSLRTLLTSLCEISSVVIVSGRSRASLEVWFEGVPCDMVCEHGACFRQDSVWSSPVDTCDEWKVQIKAVMETHSDRLPRSFVEEKVHSLAFHFRACDKENGSLRSKELLDNLMMLTANNTFIEIIQGHSVIEVRYSRFNKGFASKNWISKYDNDAFIIAIGDDITDEDMFAALPASAFSIHVGSRPSIAKSFVPEISDVLSLLRSFAEA
jgi:trehalose 6-phosphate synthase/phosphatase